MRKVTSGVSILTYQLVQLGLKNAMVSADCRLLTAKACGSRQSPVASHANCRAISAALY